MPIHKPGLNHGKTSIQFGTTASLLPDYNENQVSSRNWFFTSRLLTKLTAVFKEFIDIFHFFLSHFLQISEGAGGIDGFDHQFADEIARVAGPHSYTDGQA